MPDVWRFRRHWPVEKERLQEDLRDGDYCIGTLDRVTCAKDSRAEDIDLWPARDAVVLKALSLLLPGSLPLPAACTRLKGHGGAKYARAACHAATARHALRAQDRRAIVLRLDRPSPAGGASGAARPLHGRCPEAYRANTCGWKLRVSGGGMVNEVFAGATCRWAVLPKTFIGAFVLGKMDRLRWRGSSGSVRTSWTDVNHRQLRANGHGPTSGARGPGGGKVGASLLLSVSLDV